jgi:hypothetical protein
MVVLDKFACFPGWKSLLQDPIYNDPTTEFVLLTHWNTFVVLSEDGLSVVQAVCDASKLDLVFRKDGARISVSETSRVVAGFLREWHFEVFMEGLKIAISVDGTYVTASSDGTVLPGAKACYDWEQYFFVPRDYSERIRNSLIRVSSWASFAGLELKQFRSQFFEQSALDMRGSFSSAIDVLRPDVVVNRAFGRLGNNIIQSLNAILIGSVLGSSKTTIRNPYGIYLAGGASINDMLIEVGDEDIPDSFSDFERPTLVGQFYSAHGFESCFAWATDGLLTSIIQAFSRLVPMPSGGVAFEPRKTLVAHIRGGDVFRLEPPPSPWYSQPPAAFYLSAALDARRFGVDRVLIVAEDDKNPVVAHLLEAFPSLGISVQLQSRSVFKDFSAVRQARYVAQSFGTFAEAAALISDQIKCLWSFDRVSSQLGHGGTLASFVTLMPKVFRLKGVRSVVGRDLSGRATIRKRPLETAALARAG